MRYYLFIIISGIFLLLIPFHQSSCQDTPDAMVRADRIVSPKPPLGACANNSGLLKDGNSSLGQTYNNAACGLNYVMASRMITQRYDSYTTTGTYGCGLPCPNFTISGLPGCAVIEQAYVWFIASYDSYSGVNVTVTNPMGTPTTVAASIIGTGGDKCWGESGTLVGRAAVTAAISGNGNYTINITGISYQFSNVNGIDGATLFIIYRDPLATYQGNLIVYDGNVTGIGTAYNYNMGGFNACAASSLANAFLIVSDMQDNINGGQHPGTVNGATANYPNNFWCIDYTTTTVNAGQTSAAYGVSGLGSDCWTLGVTALYFQTTTCTTCTPSPPVPLTINTSQTNSSCGLNNGTATVTSVTGGTPPYTYSWNSSPPQTASTATGLGAGQYDVIVQDASGCSRDTVTVNIASSTGMTLTATDNDILCNGMVTGTATANASGGVLPYTYQWSSGQSVSSLTGLSAGTYTVSVSDTSTACYLTATVIITEPNPFTAGILNSADATCSGVNDGSATADAAGGVSPYSFQWDAGTGNQANATATGLVGGTYFVTATDANGCTALATITITTPGAIYATASGINISCFGGGNGTATADASGGVTPYTYLWSNSQNTQSITGLTAGTYTVTITGNDCSPSGTELVTNDNFSAGNTGFSSGYSYCNSNGCLNPEGTYAVGSNPNFFHGAFYGNDHTTGSGNFMVINGSGTPNTNVWCQTITVTPNTTYLFSTWVATMVVGSPAQLQFSINGVPLGNIFSAPNSQYVWMQFFEKWNSGANTSATICIVNQNTTLGGNDFGMDDISFQACMASCQDVASITISAPPALTQMVSVIPVTCFGNNNGSATVNVSGGTPGYSYLWDASAASQTGSTATGLIAGTYSVTFTDANGCSSTTTATVTQPSQLVASITASTNVNCFGGNTGSATVTAGGGTGVYSYLWNDANLQATPAATGLTAGTYTVGVADANTCTITATVTITEPPLLVSQITQITNVSCFGGIDGSATVTAGGGVPGYSYLWSNGETTVGSSQLAMGNYTVTVTDVNGCTAVSIATVTQPALLTAVITSSANLSCSGFNDGLAIVTAGGGITPYSYLWNDPLSQTNDSAVNLYAGSYVVQVTDNNNCLAFANVTVTQPTPLISFITGSSDVTCFGYSDGSATGSASGGTPPYNYVWNDAAVQLTPTATGLSADTFIVTVLDLNGCINTSQVIITQPPLLVSSVTSSSDVTCNGFANGSVTITASGGTPGYSYQWDDPAGQVTPTASGLGPGTFTVAVTDANNCLSTSSGTITEPPLLVTTTSSDTTICIGGTALIGITASGGTPPYSYIWDNSLPDQTNHIVNPASTNSYTVIVQDFNLCTSTAQTVTVNVYPPLNVWFDPVNEICFGESTTITANAIGGNTNYTFTWDQGIGSAGNTITVTPLQTTTYSVTVNDGCETPPANASVTVIVNSLPVVNFNDIIPGCAPLTAYFTDQSTVIGSNIAQWTWDFGESPNPGEDISSASVSHVYYYPGTFSITLTVVSGKGCSQTIVKPGLVIVYPRPMAGFYPNPSITSILAPAVSFHDLSFVLSGSVDEWFWDFDDNSTNTGKKQVHTYSDTGHYEVSMIITTDKGCRDTAYFTVVILGEFALFAPSAFTPNGDGLNEIFLPKHTGVNESTYELLIYDRWGDIIFSTTDAYKGWDGTANDGNNLAQQDVYVWIINTRDVNNVKHRFIGHVALVK